MSVFSQIQRPTMTSQPQSLRRVLAAMLLLAATACGDDVANGSGEQPDTDSGFSGDSSNSSPSSGPTGNPTSETGTDSGPDGPDGTDDGEPAGPGEDAELCDAGDEAFIKRLIPLVHGRKPDSIREVRLLVSMIEQLDMLGEDGRRAVTLGLLRGDPYLDRYKDYMFEELRVNVAGDRRNETCYDMVGNEANSPQLAEFIRDNPPSAQYDGDMFWMPDVTFSALRLDDMSPLLRAETFARMSAPFIAGNVTDPEIEEMRSDHYGRLFEATMLGRTTDCLECHRAEFATTDSDIPAFDRHHPVAGYLELGAYGPDAAEASQQRSYAIFRHDGFAQGQAQTLTNGGPIGGAITPFGFSFACGAIDLTPDPSLTGWDGYLFGDHTPNATLVDLDANMRAGFENLRSGDGLQIADDQSVDPAAAGAYLMSMHMSNRMWTHAMGFPLQVANGFPRNDQQRDILQTLTDSFVANEFSLRNLIADVATHPYFNQSPPDTCGASTPYHLPPVFEPFSREASDPSMRGNGVGDTVHRLGARVLLDSIAQAMWWNKPDVFGPGIAQVPGANGAAGCGANMPTDPCVDRPEDSTVLQDSGAFLSDGDSGFSGTDLLVMLRLENDFGQGVDPGMHGACTGPQGASCAGEDWITQLIDAAAPETDMWDVAAAVKDRMITDPSIRTEAEVATLETLMGVSLSDTVSDVGAGAAEQAARRLAGMLTNTPQFMLAGIPGRDVDPADDPTLIVSGTSTADLCAVLAPMILDNSVDGIDHGYSCSGSGITLE